ncbi:hypothetical protein [Candidatus Magnetomonas plexicatena]|uniref:hypothetical protein n=1 Tax=Candidatus Magnetomonas plexicatena TaxID=2552947 RepID=UPI001C777281|nr:hypothetical protein E2O03_007485 [Nitrospirales bacterium LBB_01]
MAGKAFEDNLLRYGAVVIIALAVFMLASEAGAQFTTTIATVKNKDIAAKLTEAQTALDEKKTAKTITQKDLITYQHKINVIRTKAVRKEQRGMRPQEAEEISKSLDILIIEIKAPDKSQ